MADNKGAIKNKGFDIRRWRDSEREKTASLSKRQKLRYIWDYYWLWIIGIGFFVVFGIWFAWRSATAIRENWIGIAFPNAMYEAGNGSGLWQDFVDYMGYDTKEKNVLFEDKLYFDPTYAAGMNNSYYQSFVAMLETGQVDAVCMRREEIEALGKSGRLIDLSFEAQALKGIYDRYKDRLVYSIPYDERYSTDPVPVGIDVSDSILMTQYHIFEQSCVFSISSYSRHIEACAAFLDWILEEENAGSRTGREERLKTGASETES